MIKMNAIILAGGKSSRFGSNKALYKLNQKPMLINIIEKLEPMFDKIYVIGNKEYKYEGLFKTEYLTDVIPDKGPLGGLYTGLKTTDSSYNYLQACDMPFVSKEYLGYMKKYISENKGYDAYIPKKKGYLEPFVGIYHKRIKKDILKLIRKDKLNFDFLFQEINIRIIDEKEIKNIVNTDRIFFNINKKEDIKKYDEFKAK
jgi:molybdopterin-guanine dinucleotide biosynthesis protein A